MGVTILRQYFGGHLLQAGTQRLNHGIVAIALLRRGHAEIAACSGFAVVTPSGIAIDLVAPS